MATLSTHKLAIALILILCTLAAWFKVGHVGLTPNSDYFHYIATAQYLAGQPAPSYPERILKPLAPLVVVALAPLTDYPTAFLIEVIAFYLAFALALYWLAYEFFEDRWFACTVALLGALSYPMLRYGLDLYTESGAQFFYVLSLALTLLYIKAPSRKVLALNGLALGLGLLWKEYSLVAGLIFGVVLLFERVAWKPKVSNLAFLALVSLLPTVLVQVWVYMAYHYTYFNWYVAGGVAGFATEFTLHNIIKSTAALLGLAWFLVPLGIGRFPTLTSMQHRFLYSALPVPLIAFAWGYVSSRLFYVMAPAFLLLAVWGLARWPKWAQVLITTVVIMANLAWLVIASAA